MTPTQMGAVESTASEDTDSGRATGAITKDDAFHVLQNRRRRAVLRYLLARPDEDTFDMRAVTEEVAAWEHDTTVQRLSSDERQRVYIALYQSHLPKLDDLGVIAYNQSRGVIEPTPLMHLFDPFLEDSLHTESDRVTVEATALQGPGEQSPPVVIEALATLLKR